MYRTKKELKSLITNNKNLSIRDAIKKVDQNGYKIIHLIDEKGFLLGIFTDSDFRKVIIDKIDLSKPIIKVINTNPIFIESEKADKDIIIKKIKKYHISQLPILRDGKLVDLFIESDFFKSNKRNAIGKKIPVFILAGGIGKRLSPITKVIPKPLIPIGEKTIIELIMDKFIDYGLNEFFLSINYKANIIEAFFKENSAKYDISFVKEKIFLGTIGSLELIKDKIIDSIFIANCDVLLDVNYKKVYEFHKNNNNDLTLIGSIIHHSIPYGICKTLDGGELIEITEKPEIDYLANVGCYIMENKCINFIPANKYYDITDLIKVLKKEGMNIGVYPISQDSWIDIGQMKEYKELIKGF
jgi:dTDP-glucose pyrophosphorylase